MLHNNKFILNGILAFSIFSLVIAYYIQYILGHKLKVQSDLSYLTLNNIGSEIRFRLQVDIHF